jgi:signal transduction histidine kinase/ActR/RegA family two-component response regulator
MRLALDNISYVNVVAASLLAVAAAVQARRGGRPARWGAAAFAVLAIVLLVSTIGGRHPSDQVTRLLVCVLLAFPYLLLRFTASFGAVAPRLVRIAAVATATLIVVSLVVPSFPQAEDEKPGWYAPYLVAILGVWTILSLVTITALWRGGAGQPTLTRRRTRLMSVATGGMNVLILASPVSTGEGATALVVDGLLFASLAAFAVGFAPPRSVRLAWRQPEQQALRHATEQLVGATTVSEVTEKLMPHVARVVGGSGAALLDDEGAVVASAGSVPPLEEAGAAGVETVHIPLSAPFRALVVATSPMTPFFGREEVALLHSLAAIADITLARCALTEREAESQVALREAKEKAERADAAKSDFLSRMSHELRTPMNVVLGFGQILEMRETLDERDREAVEHILKAGRHLLALINEVLDLSTIESGRMTVSPEPVELVALAGEAVDLIRPLADERSVSLEADLGECRYVTADRQRLKQVLLNLLSNAVKYNRDGGEVALSCRPAGDRLQLLVADTGPGVPEALRDKLFEPFERLGAERKGVEGTGLGLALSRRLMHLMGGEIGVEGREGQGSVFWIELDVVPDRHREARPPRRAATNGRASSGERANGRAARRLLVIEDNLTNLGVIEGALAADEQVELLPAMTGGLGLELAREHLPDLILLDQHLPDLAGEVLLHRLKADPDLRAIPVVMVSADATPGQARRMLDRGAADYLTKPLDVPHFLRVIERLLGGGGGSP